MRSLTFNGFHASVETVETVETGTVLMLVSTVYRSPLRGDPIYNPWKPHQMKNRAWKPKIENGVGR